MKAFPRSRFTPRSLELLRDYDLKRLKADVGAGLTVGLMALPLALALGVASVPAGARTPFPAPAIGIATAIMAGFVVSALGGSRVQIAGPSAVFLPVILLVVERYGYDGLMLATLMAGGMLAAMGLARLGSVARFIPFPVASGLATGIALLVMVSQATDFLGIEAAEPAPREFLERIAWLWAHIPEINPQAAATGVACVVLILVWPRLGHRRVPGTLVAVVFASILIALLGLHHADGVATLGTRFGPGGLSLALPPFTVPMVSLARLRGLLAPAVTIALLGSMEALLSAVVADGLVKDRHNADTELIAQGAANIVCPLFCGLPSTGGVARTLANVRCGGATPLAGMVHAATLLLAVAVFSRFAQYVPMAALAAVLVMAALRMGEWNELARLRRMPRGDAVALVATLGATLLFDLVVAVEVATVLAAFLLVRRAAAGAGGASPETGGAPAEAGGAQPAGGFPGDVLVYEVAGASFFGAAEKMEDAVEGAGRLPRVLILRMQRVVAMDATALNALGSVIERIQAGGGEVILCGTRPQVLPDLAAAGLVDRIGPGNMRATVDEALQRARESGSRPV